MLQCTPPDSLMLLNAPHASGTPSSMARAQYRARTGRSASTSAAEADTRPLLQPVAGEVGCWEVRMPLHGLCVSHLAKCLRVTHRQRVHVEVAVKMMEGKQELREHSIAFVTEKMHIGLDHGALAGTIRR